MQTESKISMFSPKTWATLPPSNGQFELRGGGGWEEGVVGGGGGRAGWLKLAFWDPNHRPQLPYLFGPCGGLLTHP